MEDIEDAWGQLVSLTDIDSSPVRLSADKFSIGRARDCDLSLPENKLVSGHHCQIERDASGKVLLYDNSTNGTLLNMKYKISKGLFKELQHGDEFFIVHKKNAEELNVGYIYQDLKELSREEDTQEYSPPHDVLDATLPDEECNTISPKAEKRQREASVEPEEPKTKKSKTEGESDSTTHVCKSEAHTTPTSDTDTSKDDKCADEKDTAKQVEYEPGEKPKPAPSEEKKESDDSKGKEDKKKEEPEKDDSIGENLVCIICQEIMHDCISLQPCLHSFCAGCYSDWMERSNECPSCRKKVKRINKNHIVNNLIEAYLKEHPDKKRPEEDIKELNSKNKVTRDMPYPKENRDLEYDVDYDSFYDESEREEEEEEEDEVEGSSDGTDVDSDGGTTSCSSTSLYPKKTGAVYDSDESYEDTDDDDSDVQDNSDVATIRPVLHLNPVPPPILGFGTPFFGTIRPPKTVCRQCPEYKDPGQTGTPAGGVLQNIFTTVKNIMTGTGGDGGTAATNKDTTPSGEGPSTSGGDKPPDTAAGSQEPGPSTSGTGGDGDTKKKTIKDDVKVMVTPPPYVCPANQTHVLCQCCLQPMPDRRNMMHLAASPLQDHPQQCTICYRAYCHAYWGCKKADCLGCIGKFQDLNFGRKSLAGLILENNVESDIFKDYIDSKGLSVKDVLQECLTRLEAGKYTCPDQYRYRITSNTALCWTCGLRNFRQLAFQYRKDIPKDQLPANVTARADCYWGHNCRTQRNKPHHAANFNHICDQTRH